MNTRNTHPAITRFLSRRITAFLLSTLLLVGLLLPAMRVTTYAEERADYSFHFENRQENAVAGVIVTLTRIGQDTPTPDPEPDDPEPDDPEPGDPEPGEPEPEDPEPGEPEPQEPTIYELRSDDNGNARFIALPFGTYSYSITVPDGYHAVDGGTLEINEDGSQSLILLAIAPTGSIHITGSGEYGTVAQICTELNGIGNMSYVWYKDSVCLPEAQEAILSFPHLQFSDSGTYRCEIRSDLCDPESENSVLILEAELTVVPHTPEIKLSFDPSSGSAFSYRGVTVTATVRHSSYSDAVVPTGKVKIYIRQSGQDEIYRESIWLSLSRGSASQVFYLKKGSYTITASYMPSNSSNYYVETESQEYYYEVGQKIPEKDVDYTVNEPTGENGWYSANGPLRIAPKGVYDQIRVIGSEEAMNELVFNNETSENGGYVSFELLDSETEEISLSKTEWFKKDNTAPDELSYIHIHSNNSKHFVTTFYASDKLSGVASFRWYDSSGEVHEIPATEDPGFLSPDRYSCRCDLSKDDFLSFRYYTAVDYAGNESDRHYMEKKIVTLSFSDASTVTDSNGNVLSEDDDRYNGLFFHRANVLPLTFIIEAEGVDSAEGIVVKVNGLALEEPNWVLNDATNTLTLQGPTFTEDGRYVISVEADGFVLVCSDFGMDTVNTYSVSSAAHIIDTADPRIIVSYDPQNPENGYTAFSTEREAVVTVTETYFRPENLQIAAFSATDIAGNPLENQESLQAQLQAILQEGTWQNDGDVHSSSGLPFEQDAHYEFTLICEDFGGNKGRFQEDNGFVVDKTPPCDLSISYNTNAISSFLTVITFGFYQNEVEICITAEDPTSGIDHFTVHYEKQDGSYSLGDLTEDFAIPSEDIEISYDETGRKATASFKLSADQFRQYRGSLSFTATDRAGNISDVKNGDGVAKDSEGNEFEMSEGAVVVVDNIAPERKIILPEPQLIRDSSLAQISGDLRTLANQEDSDYILYYTRTDVNPVSVIIQITEANFDPEDPDLQVTLNEQPYEIAWSRENEDSEPNIWTGKVDLKTDGTYEITAEYTDHSGNVMKSYRSHKIVLDRVNPELTQFAFTPATVDGITQTSQFIERLEYGYYFKTDFAVTVSAADAALSSGLHYVSYRLVSYQNGKKTSESTHTVRIQNGIAQLAIPAGFKGQIFAECYDLAGNKSNQVSPQGLIVDRTAPEISIVTNQNTGFHDAVGNRLFITDTNLTVTIRDSVSGLKRIQYRQQSEKGTGDWVTTEIANNGNQLGAALANGWVISAMDQNLVTAVSKTFTYSVDDNDIFLTVNAFDRCENAMNNVKSETFTVDKTSPTILVAFDAGIHNGIYYSRQRTATVTVHEHNFDASRIQTVIENGIGSVPTIRFDKLSDSDYRAVLEFPQGDYHFDISGSDLGGHTAAVTFTGGNEREFIVDTTKPSIATNFSEFHNTEHQNHFADAKTAKITVTEHNFSAELTQLRILKKQAGSSAEEGGFAEITDSVLKDVKWSPNSGKDEYSISFTLEDDAVYQIEFTLSDKAGNQGERLSTEVFEIDRTVPVIISRNSEAVSADNVNFLDIYDYTRENDPAPELRFGDTNLRELEYELYVWIPDYSDKNQYPVMKAQRVFLPLDREQKGILTGDTITLSDFKEDGIYILKVTAVDMAGNRSSENVNTFVRIVKNPILAYIEDSNLSKGTGLFSFQEEDGTPISMRSDRFQDLYVVVFSKSGSAVDVVIRDGNGDETNAGEYTGKPTANYEEIYGIDVGRYLVPQSRFTELYPDDTDAKLYLSVVNDSEKRDLGVIHIDNIVPTCMLPDGFHSLKWYFGNDDRTFTLTNISESLDEANCVVYDNGIPLEKLLYDQDAGTLSFTLSKGWHNVGIKLTDLAGNTNHIQEITHIQIGLFWLWIIIASFALVMTGVVLFIRSKRKKAILEE